MSALLLVLAGLVAEGEAPRKSSSIAPSLPELSAEEEKKLDDVVDRLIQADTGRLRGAEGKKAFADFDKLKSDAIPALIRGLNKAAEINHSCPVLLISKKLNSLLMASDDEQLLQYARDEIGAGVGKTMHNRVLQDLRARCMLRRNALAARPPIPPKGPSVMTTLALINAIPKVKADALAGVLEELGKRDPADALRGFVTAANSLDRDKAKLGRDKLDEVLGKLNRSELERKMQEDNVELRRSAVRVGPGTDIELVPAVIERLTDASVAVRSEAREAMKKLAKDKDFGPSADATKEQQKDAQRRWRQWWEEKVKQP